MSTKIEGEVTMMKTIAVVAVHKDFAAFIKADLEQYFSAYAEIHAYAEEEIEHMEEIPEEFVVMSALTVFRKVQPKMKEHALTQVISFAVSRDNLARLSQVPRHQKVLMVNVDYKMCMQVIAQIYELGYRDFDFVPYYGDEENRDRSIKTAVTPDEMTMIPADMERIIDIGGRPVDINCIVELANKMGIEDIFGSRQAKEARKRFVTASFGIDRVLSDTKDKNEQIKTLVELIEDGIILTDASGVVLLSNKKARSILKTEIDGFNTDELLPDFPIRMEAEVTSDKVIVVDGKDIIVNVSPIISDDRYTGNIITLKNFEETEEKQHGIRAQIARIGHGARYTFDDIVGVSSQIRESVKVAERMAKSDSSVLIIGESGTGKEVFAQSIHNGSGRSKRNFVALNCAAIPEHLLESELFGYEEGAFTGARKGGKIGYFELAHQGTIFLDEIGEMPLALQSKLLRVLEEKTVTRIGSSKLIDIDVRIIAATNKNLLELVERKEFREDLYYRINVLPLNIPPLRERKEDIPFLIDVFMENMGKELTFSDEASKRLRSHRWNGNIRELKNVIEYLESLGKRHIETGDLPVSVFMVPEQKVSAAAVKLKTYDGLKGEFRDVIFGWWNDRVLIANILLALQEAAAAQKKIGRRQLETILQEKGFLYTETEIRTCLSKLAGLGFVRSQHGRGGSVILPKGDELLKEIMELMGE